MSKPALKLVDENGEVHEDCPDCAAHEDEIAGLVQSIGKLKRQIRAMEDDRAERRRVHPDRPMIEAIHEFWQQTTGRTGKLGDKRFDAVAALVKLEEEEWKIRLAIIGAAVAANRSDSTGERYDDLELICRDETKLDSFARRAWLWGQEQMR